MLQDDEGGSEAYVLFSRIRTQAASGVVRITQHAQQAMAEDDVNLDDVLHAIRGAETLENYPEHRRGACCLLGGLTAGGRPIHIVCTTARPVLVIVTVYEPRPPRLTTPTQRGRGR